MDSEPAALPQIGLFVGSTDEAWENLLVQGATGFAMEAGARIVCFNSGTLRSHHGYESMRNALYDLVDQGNVDALVLSGTLSHHVEFPEFVEFFRRYAPLPVVNLLVRVEGLPCVVAGNRAGMEALMDHLLEVHGYRRMAFLGGPPGQQEAETREAVFRERLAARGVGVEERWMVNGDYTRGSGVRAVQELLSRDLEGLQGIVCANDAMALGARDVLTAEGFRVPEDLFLTGFDDAEEGRFLIPALTTVRQSPVLVAREGARIALDLHRGGSVPPVIEVPAELVVRASCGCPPAPLAVNEGQLRQEVLARLNTERQSGRIIAFGERLDTAFTLPAILEIVAQGLPALGIRALWLSLLEEVDRSDGTAVPLLVPGGVPESPGPFPSRDLIPGGLRHLAPEHRVLVVELLYSQNLRLGLAVFSTDPPGVRVTGSLRSQIGGALHGVRLLEERRRAQDQLVLAGKMAALGNLVAGVAHEINTPLGVALSAASYLESTARDYRRRLVEGSVPVDDQAHFAQSAGEACTLIVSNLDRAADLVHSFKQVAADQTSEIRRTFAVREYIQETIVSLQPQWKRRPVTVSVEGPEGFEIDSYPGALAQVTTNLILNALNHGFHGPESGSIQVVVEPKGDWVRLRYKDDGRGIEPAHLAKVFEPFFTTARAQGGTGLGLHIVYNLVAQVLGGSIACDSAPGKGARFDVVIPRVAPGVASRSGVP